MRHGIVSVFLLSTPLTLFAESSPWLATPGDTNVQLTVLTQEADEFWLGDNKVQLADELTQTTAWIAVNRGLTDNLSADFRTGFARSEHFPDDDQDGITDSTLGITWRFNDEFLSTDNRPSAALRFAATIEGDYDTGIFNAIGDGSSGAETSLILGKVLSSRFAIAGEVGYRYRNSDAPNESFANVNAFYTIAQNLSLSIGYQQINSYGNLDLGGPGFTPRRFSEVEEDIESVTLGLSFNISQSFNAAVNYGTVIDGKNTSDNEVAAINVGFSF